MSELSRLPEAARKLALDRFRLLQPQLDQNRPLRAVASEAGIPYRTAQRWAADTSSSASEHWYESGVLIAAS